MTTNGPDPTPESLWLTAEMRVTPSDAGKAPDGTPTLPRFSMVAYTGGAMRLEGWKHPVVVDLAGMTIPSQSRPIRVGHNTDRLVGHTHAIAQEDGRLVASGVLSIPGPDTERVVAGSRNGFPWQASIGARVDQFEFVKDGQVAAANGREFPGPVVIVRKSTLGEISFVDLGADGNTSASVAAKAQESATVTTTATTAGTPDPTAGDTVQAVRAAAASEVKRIAAIRRIFAGQHAEAEAQAIQEGWDETRAELARLRLDRPAAPAVAGTRADDRFPAAQMLEAALALTRPPMQPERHYPADLLQAAEDRYGPGLKIRQVIYFVARANGYTGSPFIDKRTFGDAMYYAWTLPMTVRAAGTSTLSLPAILSNLANKELLDAYREEDQTWREIAIVRSVSDFKTVTSHRLLDNMEYEEVAPDGEIKHGTVAEETYTRQAKTYGKMFALTREKIIDDDMSALDDIRDRLGAGAARKLNSVFWKTFLNNSSFFTAPRGNFLSGATTALGLDGTGLQEGILAFRKLKSPDKKRIGGTPTILLVPPELQFVAQRLYQSTTVNTGGASTKDSVPNDNIHAGKYRPVVCDWLSDTEFAGHSAKAWYLFRNPGVLAPVAVSFLDGVQTPTVEAADADFNKLGIQFRGYFDFGVDLAEPLAGIKVKGEA
jgi:phage major head subunit gpT-like protein